MLPPGERNYAIDRGHERSPSRRHLHWIAKVGGSFRTSPEFGIRARAPMVEFSRPDFPQCRIPPSSPRRSPSPTASSHRRGRPSARPRTACPALAITDLANVFGQVKFYKGALGRREAESSLRRLDHHDPSANKPAPAAAAAQSRAGYSDSRSFCRVRGSRTSTAAGRK